MTEAGNNKSQQGYWQWDQVGNRYLQIRNKTKLQVIKEFKNSFNNCVRLLVTISLTSKRFARYEKFDGIFLKFPSLPGKNEKLRNEGKSAYNPPFESARVFFLFSAFDVSARSRIGRRPSELLYMLCWFDIATLSIRFASFTLNTQNASHKPVHSLFDGLSVAGLEIH